MDKRERKGGKQKEVDKLMSKYKDDPKFQEFLRVHQGNCVESWNNDAILKAGRDYCQDLSAKPEAENESEASKSAHDGKLSDLEYLKSKGFVDKVQQHGEKKVFFTVKLEGLPYNAKKKDVKGRRTLQSNEKISVNII